MLVYGVSFVLPVPQFSHFDVFVAFMAAILRSCHCESPREPSIIRFHDLRNGTDMIQSHKSVTLLGGVCKLRNTQNGWRGKR